MTIGKLTLVFALSAGSMFTAGRWGYVQAPVPPREPRVPSLPSQPAVVISGNDLGFRIDNHRGNIPVGRIVIRVNGEWVEVEESTALKRLTAR